MRTIGIICEYDPFHGGHKYQIDTVRASGADTVVCLMSGNAVQRGEFAVADKYVRAEAALRGGADLVLELPYPYCSAGADFFAGAAVDIFDRLGVDDINFGSECGDIERLFEAAKLTASGEFSEQYKNGMESDFSSGSAEKFSETFKKIAGFDLPDSPNDLLGTAYIRAAIRSGSKIKFTVTKRRGGAFNDENHENEFPSATAIRKLISDGDVERAISLLPEKIRAVFEKALSEKVFPTDKNKLSSAVLSFFRMNDGGELERFAEAGGGVAGRLSSAAKRAKNLDEMFEFAATKRYTNARLRRAALFSMTGVTFDDLRAKPEYTSLLAANKRGLEFLSGQKNGRIRIVTKPADAPDCRETELSRNVDKLFTLTLPEPRPEGEFLRRSPKILQSD